jgi:putative addiction module killer protein
MKSDGILEYDVLQTEIYEKWFDSLKDIKTKARIDAYVNRLKCGNFSNAEPVGEGISELRLQFGAGYRIYFIKQQLTVIILLAGGDKSTQKKDIKLAKQTAKEV